MPSNTPPDFSPRHQYGFLSLTHLLKFSLRSFLYAFKFFFSSGVPPSLGEKRLAKVTNATTLFKLWRLSAVIPFISPPCANSLPTILPWCKTSIVISAAAQAGKPVFAQPVKFFIIFCLAAHSLLATVSGLSLPNPSFPCQRKAEEPIEVII